MRNLTILREKKFVASLMSVKVYIEDPVNGDLKINGVMCRKLGAIKNGQSQTFEIGNEAAKVYIIGDKLSKGFCNEFYQLEAGEEDISLSGRNHFNPMVGNPFYFNNNNNPEVLKNRQVNKNKGIAFMTVSFIVGFALGFLIVFYGAQM